MLAQSATAETVTPNRSATCFGVRGCATDETVCLTQSGVKHSNLNPQGLDESVGNPYLVGVTLTEPGGEDWVPACTFASRLVLLRRTLGLSQDEAANICGVNPSTWATWELGRSPRNMGQVVAQIHASLGVSRDWLMWGEETPLELHRTDGILQLSIPYPPPLSLA